MARFLEDAVVVLDAMVAREVDPSDPATATCHHNMPTGSSREVSRVRGGGVGDGGWGSLENTTPLSFSVCVVSGHVWMSGQAHRVHHPPFLDAPRGGCE